MKRFNLSLLIVAITFTLLACSAESIYLNFYIESQADALTTPAGNDERTIAFTVTEGESVDTIANQLVGQQLISDAELFHRYVQYKELDAGIQAGIYDLNQTMTIPEIARALQHAEAKEQQVTLPEGKRMEELAILISEQTSIAPEAFLQLAQTGWRQTDLPTQYPLTGQIPLTGTLEGYLFPDTYRLPVDATAYDLVNRMLANLTRQVTPEIQQGFSNQGLTVHQGLTLASIVEREAVIAAERPIIAGVYYNRLRDGWPLSACPTVQYALGYRPEEGDWWKSQLYFSDLDVESPYNTYRHLGLPPAPIANPGSSAIQAAAAPAQTDYYFFMVDCGSGDGSHAFARTEAEHLTNFEACGGVYSSPEQ
ncbi:MAG: endolytic transglycosylase MltG [Chloroflexota bacterium]|nr:endolytic transglycosylase MltG [Chloroflexota bacterium]